MLRPGGVLSMIEPGMTALSYPFFRHLHQEPADLTVDPFKAVGSLSGKDPWDSNQAIPTLLFARDHNRAEVFKRVPEFRLVKLKWLSVLAYPLSGGFKRWCLVSPGIASRLIQLEDRLPDVILRHMAFRLFTVLERVERSAG